MPIDLSKLNSEQKKAVSHEDGPLLIVAGAGTGKTTVITNRLARLIEEKGIKPNEILALTFTDKASGEMDDRISQLLSLGYADLWVSTFHAFCERILQNHGLDIGLSTNFKLVDQTAAWLLVRRNIDRFKLKYYKPLGNPTKFIHAMLAHFSHCKDQEVFPEDYLKYSRGKIEEKEKIREIARTYKIYQELLLENDLLDFGDLLNYCLSLFRRRPAILKKYRDQFKYVLVDEFQDTNWIQYELVKLLAQPKNNLTVCADDDQAIYRWRGASFGNIIQFKKDFPDAIEAVLIKNYRSCQNILDLSHRFIQANNPNRLEYLNKIDKKLVAVSGCAGIIKHLHYKTLEQEVQGTVSSIINILKEEKDTTFGDFAILVRANESANSYSRACERAGIAYQFLALKGLYSKPVVLDIISYFKLLNDYHEGSAVWRVLNMPFLNIPMEDVAKATHYNAKKSQSLFESLKEFNEIPGLSEPAKTAIGNLLSMIEKHSAMTAEKNVSEIMVSFLFDSGYLKFLEKRAKKEDFDYISQLFNKIKAFEDANLDPNLRHFMEELELELESGEEGKLEFDPGLSDTVKIMTVHASKGLEFKHVFMVNLVDRKFPTIERKEQIELPKALIKDIVPEGDVHLQEERRLFYVGMTRAKSGLYFTSAKDYGGVNQKKLSLFLAELGYKNGEQEEPVKNIRISSYKKPQTRLPLPDHFSFTQLAAFEKCPRQYQYAHIWKIRPRGKAVFSFGKTMHNTLYESLSAGGKVTLGKIKEVYEKEWINEWFDDQAEKDNYHKLGLKSLKLFWQDYSRRSPKILTLNNAPALEVGFNLKINGYTINGKIDRIDEAGKGVEIIDYKTGTVKDKLRPEEKQQLLIYQIAAREVFGLKPEKLTYFYLENATTATFIGSEGDIEKQKEKIAGQIEKIEKSNFYATPGWHCEWCDYKGICEFARK